MRVFFNRSSDDFSGRIDSAICAQDKESSDAFCATSDASDSIRAIRAKVAKTLSSSRLPACDKIWHAYSIDEDQAIVSYSKTVEILLQLAKSCNAKKFMSRFEGKRGLVDSFNAIILNQPRFAVLEAMTWLLTSH